MAFSFLFKRNHDNQAAGQKKCIVKDSPDSYVDSSTIAQDERKYYQPDKYYTYYSCPGTYMSRKVITFEERKTISYPSRRGLYVAEIMLLEYCKRGTMPKPQNGYQGMWWFEYGIRDVGHALESLYNRGFIKWGNKYDSLNQLKATELKEILEKHGIPVTGKKNDLISMIKTSIPEDMLAIPNYTPKYRLTELGIQELSENEYVVYMSNHRHNTTEDSRFGQTFNVWDINKLFPNGDTSNWRNIVGKIELQRFGVDMANNTEKIPTEKTTSKTKELCAEVIRKYLSEHNAIIQSKINTPGDGYKEESKGLDYKKIGKDKEALEMFYIAIGKEFDAPALYQECAILLRKYGMLEEELSVLNAGLNNVSKENNHWTEIYDRKEKLITKLKSNRSN